MNFGLSINLSKQALRYAFQLYLLFEGKGIHILHRYKNDLNSFFKLKDNSNLNKELNVLAKLAGNQQTHFFPHSPPHECYLINI